MDNLNMRTPVALYEVFEPAEAPQIIRKLEFHHTPKHDSWLNMAEIELCVLTQYLDRRLPEVATGSSEIAAWDTQRNADCTTIH